MSALEMIARVRRMQALRAKMVADRESKKPLATKRVSIEEFGRRYANDFDGFCALLDIIPKNGVRCKFELNEIQRDFNTRRTGRDNVLKPRQVGFTTLEQARDAWVFLTRPGARVVATCQSITDHAPVKLLSKNYRVFFESLIAWGLDLQFTTEALAEWVVDRIDSSLRIIEAGASEAAAQKKGRAGVITRLHLTETAFYEYADETLNAMLECVPARDTGSEIVSESTPNGAAGYFYEHYKASEEGRSQYAAHFYPWFKQSEYRTDLTPGEVVSARDDRERDLVDRRGITPEQLKWYRQKGVDKGADKRDQEYPSDAESCFLVSGRQFFEKSVTAALVAAAVQPLRVEQLRWDGARGQLRIFAEPTPGASYVLAADTSEGVGGDAGTGIVRERGTARHMATIHGQFKPWELAHVLAQVGTRYNRAIVAVERNNHGHACLRALDAEQHYSNIFKDRDDRPGWVNVEVYRTAALDALEQAHRDGSWKSADPFVLSEIRTFVTNDRGKAEAAPGAHDDLVMAEAICWDVLAKPEAARGVGKTPIGLF